MAHEMSPTGRTPRQIITQQGPDRAALRFRAARNEFLERCFVFFGAPRVHEEKRVEPVHQRVGFDVDLPAHGGEVEVQAGQAALAVNEFAAGVDVLARPYQEAAE